MLRPGKIYARNGEALDKARAPTAAAPAMLALHRDSISTATVVTRADVVKKIDAAAGRGGPRYSRGTGSGLSQLAAQAVVDAIKARWANAPEVVVVTSMQDTAIPAEVRAADAKQRSQGASGEPEGFFYKGKVYIVAGALNKPGDVTRVLFHEALGHYGLRGVFGDSLTPILKQIAAIRRGEVEAKECGLATTRKADCLQVAEEVLAVMAWISLLFHTAGRETYLTPINIH